MVTADILVSTIVMGGLLLVVAGFIHRAHAWRSYTVPISNSGMSTVKTVTGEVPPEETKSESIYPIRFILGAILLVGALTALIEVTTTTGFYMAAGIVAFFVFVYLGLVAVITSHVIWT